MKKSKRHLIMLILPWVTVPFLGRNDFKKYLPSAIFSCTLTKAFDLFGEKRDGGDFIKASDLLIV